MTENTMHAYRTFGRRQTNVYIVSKDRLAEAESVRQEQDVIILDDRASADPNMQIRQSYKITRWADRAAILRILLEYNAEHPGPPAGTEASGP